MYEQTKWKDHAVERPRTYLEEINEDGSKTFTPAPGETYQQGTPQNAANFNNAETGIADTHIFVRAFTQFFLNFKRWLVSKIALLDVMIRFDIEQTLEATEQARVRTALGLGDAALKTVGTAAGNVPVLDETGKLVTQVIPSLAIGENMGSVTSQADLTTLSTAESSDIAEVTDDTDDGLNGIYMLFGDYSVLSNWKQLTPPGAVFSVNGSTGAVTITYTSIGAQQLISASGILKGDGSGGISAATEGTDFVGIVSGKANPERTCATVMTKTASYTLILTDAGKFIPMSSTSALTLTIPLNASVAFPVGTEIEIMRYNTGTVTIAATSGVTLLSAGSLVTIAERYASVGLKKIATDTWLLTGYLA